MAQVKTYSVADLADGTTDDTLSHIKVMDEQYAIDNGVVADPEAVTWKERVFIKCQLKATNDVDGPTVKEDRNCPWQQATPANFPGLTDFLDQWKIIFDKQRADASLDPV